MPFAIKPRQTVLFIGDSITDCGRRDAHAPLGCGYVKLATDLIRAKYPAHGLTVMNRGIGGNTVEDLANRWTDDALRHRPDWLSVKIGINDLHRHKNGVEGQNSPADFECLYDHILTETRRKTKARIVLVDPFYISKDKDKHSVRSNVLNRLPSYVRVVHKMARKHKTRLVKTQELFMAHLKHNDPDVFCPEPVHPYESGHMVIALGWLKALGW